MTTFVDTTSGAEAAEWDALLQTAWVERNAENLPEPKVESFRHAMRRQEWTARNDAMRQLFDAAEESFWGRGTVPVRPGSLERLQLLYFAVRVASEAYDIETAHAFLLGRNPYSLGRAPLLVIALYGRSRAWELIDAISGLVRNGVELPPLEEPAL